MADPTTCEAGRADVHCAAVSEERFTLKTADNLELRGRHWPVQDAIGNVALVHGFFEHTGRWSHVARAMNEAGISLWGIDLRGHGESEGPRGDTPSYQHMLEDLDAYFEHVEGSGGPMVAYGHSFGGGLLLNWLLKRERELPGALATSPWLRLTRPPNVFLRTFSRLAHKVAPHVQVKVGIRKGALSKNPDIHERYVSDPLVHRYMSPMVAESAIAEGEWSIANAARLRTNTWLSHGLDDEVTDPRGTAAFAGAAPDEHLVFSERPDMRHEMHNELEQDEFIAAVVEYARARLEMAKG